ncbi:methyltransferase-like protein 25B [Mercenaria mercenaria]|uniref:methyltransferase-like protein 25B n=1 Tax=Mercenaria mercenaria TaxID=6596 RepID=UPI00234E96A7|nr:methyltransferase-like protein 25B [Mercenaria mercenaria]
MIKVSPENLEKIQLYIQQLILFLQNCTWILDAYVSDFYFKNHWDRLPESWCSVLSDLTTEELSFLLDRHPVHLRKVAPLSLLSFKSCCDAYSLDRRCEGDISNKLQNLFSGCADGTAAGSRSRTDGKDNETSPVQFQPLDESGKLHAFFKKHVKPKKQHEIKNLGQVIYLLSKHIECDNVVDVGSGLGHLARLLSFGYNLNVTSVEAAGTHAPKATKYDREIDREIKKKIMAAEGNDCGKISLPCHVTSMIYPNMTSDEFIAIITSQQKINSETFEQEQNVSSETFEQEQIVTSETAQQQQNINSGTSQQLFDSGTRKIMRDDSKYRACALQSKEVEKGNDNSNEFAETVGDNLTKYSEQVSENLTENSEPVRDRFDKLLTDRNKRMSNDGQNYKGMKYAKLESDSLNSHCGDPLRLERVTSSCNSETGSLIGNISETDLEARVELDSESTKSGLRDDTVTSCDLHKQSGRSYLSDNEVCEISNSKTPLTQVGTVCQNTDTLDVHSPCKLQSFGEQIDSSQWRFVLTGLHACGDLTPTFLRFFVNCDAAAGLASVGCCYMKISDESCGVETVGYPMSRYCSSLPHHQLSYASRELACHFADTYSQRLKECPPLLKIHSYRAALEWIANKLCPDFKRTAVQIPTKKIKDLQFDRYVRLGLQKLNIPEEQLPDELLHQADRMTEKWKDVVAFYTIRLALAPVVETLVLLDRMMFLYEKGYTSALVPVFDPGLSPRNFVLLSWKDST